MIPVFVGYDARESIAYHTFCQSVIETTSDTVQFVPLNSPMLGGFDGQQDGSNAFIYSRYLVPSLMKWDGWAIFADGDMICTQDLVGLWNLRDDQYAVMVAKHNYETAYPRKYIGTSMESDNVNYPRKNWSSVMLWNCYHRKNQILTPEFVAEAGPTFMHRFQWLKDEEIGELPMEWNWLVGEYEPRETAKLYHYTLGVPSIPHYKDCPHAEHWFKSLDAAVYCAGEQILKEDWRDGSLWSRRARR